ncbi:MAG TPA: response regulator [Opitutaceae bacterium]|nr:response regulator [Opitutaceae bacterium]
MRTVLVIEDNPDNLRIVAYALRHAGYTLVSSDRGEEAVELALRERPAFVLMDINLPGIGGLEATRRIRETPELRDMPIVAVTSYAMTGDRERILAAGCNGYIEKPIDPMTFIDKVHAFVGRPTS